ncbi:MAG: DUF4164 family protein [Hyphomicrobiaceae bacterium]|nr:DUF4164 family protein [Hyphomicrobiaceae bacterium]MDX2449356.1 DUF4164 family protein [Hyphomicrobiaceae bacterium]
MDEPKALQQATRRLDSAVDELEGRLQQVFYDGDSDASAGVLKEQVRFLTDERDQLLVDLEAERSRVRRLKAANDEVSGRLEAMTGTLKDMMPVFG